MGKRKSSIIIALLALFGVFLSGVIHELGHATVGKLAGLKIIKFQPWLFFGRVHVRFTGDTTDSWYALCDISGMLMTVVVGLIGIICFTLASRKKSILKMGIWLFIPMLFQCLAWVGLPMAIILGAKIRNDDVTNFIQHSGWNPLGALLIGLYLMVICAIVFKWAYKYSRPV